MMAQHAPFALDEGLAGVLADWICGDLELFVYRSGGKLAPFFRSAGFATCPEHDGSTRKSWVVARLKELAISQANLEEVLTATADPRNFVQGDVVDHERWRRVIATMNKRLALEGLRVVERGVGVGVIAVQPHMPRGGAQEAQMGTEQAESPCATQELLVLIGNMVVGDKDFGHYKGSAGAAYFTRAGWVVTRECPNTGWESWATEQLGLWCAQDNDAVRKLLAAMAHPAEFLDKSNRVRASEREKQVGVWNGFLAPHGWRITATSSGATAERVVPGYLPAQGSQVAVSADAPRPDWAACPGSATMTPVWDERWGEVASCKSGGAHLAAVVLLGSVVEAVLFEAIKSSPKEANQAKAAPKDKDTAARVRPFHDWNLDALIEVAHELGMVTRDRRDFASTLRDWRNIVHLRHQTAGDYHVDQHTVEICEKVAYAVIASVGAWAREKRGAQ